MEPAVDQRERVLVDALAQDLGPAAMEPAIEGGSSFAQASIHQRSATRNGARRWRRVAPGYWERWP